ncbi:hypothetical protein MBEHAL_1292 [Halarchaeum acidiphilum MH1-52-1]|uniref:Uncharacterized protein n=1 Tax=Halarchaeum acidiphilum MH1-52-1 TaxID=1261545 RepID=U2YUT7_9EURY|nr:hypothetical protein MBEHAL_1292 [Halarchaeum acidiphilum MH1-52-1]
MKPDGADRADVGVPSEETDAETDEPAVGRERGEDVRPR